MSLPRFGQLLVHTFRFLLLFKMVHDRYSDFHLFFCLVAALLDVFFSFQFLIFCNENQRVTLIYICSFSFCLNLLFGSCFLISIHIAPRIRCFDIISPWILSDPLHHPWHLHDVLLSVTTPAKYILIADFCLTSPCFPVPSCEYTLLPPWEPICTHPEPFAIILIFVWQNMMFGEISPTISSMVVWFIGYRIMIYNYIRSYDT